MVRQRQKVETHGAGEISLGPRVRLVALDDKNWKLEVRVQSTPRDGGEPRLVWKCKGYYGRTRQGLAAAALNAVDVDLRLNGGTITIEQAVQVFVDIEQRIRDVCAELNPDSLKRA